jgi:hypothetical protein
MIRRNRLDVPLDAYEQPEATQPQAVQSTAPPPLDFKPMQFPPVITEPRDNSIGNAIGAIGSALIHREDEDENEGAWKRMGSRLKVPLTSYDQ